MHMPKYTHCKTQGCPGIATAHLCHISFQSTRLKQGRLFTPVFYRAHCLFHVRPHCSYAVQDTGQVHRSCNIYSHKAVIRDIYALNALNYTIPSCHGKCNTKPHTYVHRQLITLHNILGKNRRVSMYLASCPSIHRSRCVRHCPAGQRPRLRTPRPYPGCTSCRPSCSSAHGTRRSPPGTCNNKILTKSS